MLEEEEANVSGKSQQKGKSSKVTRAQIEYQKQKDVQIQRAAEKERQKETEQLKDFVVENPNQAMADHLANEGYYIILLSYIVCIKVNCLFCSFVS